MKRFYFCLRMALNDTSRRESERENDFSRISNCHIYSLKLFFLAAAKKIRQMSVGVFRSTTKKDTSRNNFKLQS